MGRPSSPGCSTPASSRTRSPSRRSIPTGATRIEATLPRGAGRAEPRVGRRRTPTSSIVALKPQHVVRGARRRGAVARRATRSCSRSRRAITIAELEAAAPGRPVVRAMPNTPALVRRGASAIAAGTPRRRGRPRAGRAAPRRGRHRRPRAREDARRGDRALGLGPGLRVPAGRGAHRRRRPQRPAARRRDHARAPDDPRRRRAARRRATRAPRRCAPRSPRRAARPRPGCARSSRDRCAARSSTRSTAATERSRELGPDR